MKNEMVKDLREFALLKDRKYNAEIFDDYVTHAIAGKLINNKTNLIDGLSYVRRDNLSIFIKSFLKYLSKFDKYNKSILKILSYYTSTNIFKDASFNKVDFLDDLFIILFLGTKYISDEKLSNYLKHIKDNKTNGKLDSKEIVYVVSRIIKDIKDVEI